MYLSGVWRGFWEQEYLGKQPMEGFELHFAHGEVRGHGLDVVGRFTITGTYHPRTGSIEFIKQYLGKHQVHYLGRPDGEGSILGTWTILNKFGREEMVSKGPFMLRADLPKPRGDEPIQEITR